MEVPSRLGHSGKGTVKLLAQICRRGRGTPSFFLGKEDGVESRKQDGRRRARDYPSIELVTAGSWHCEPDHEGARIACRGIIGDKTVDRGKLSETHKPQNVQVEIVDLPGGGRTVRL